MTIDTLDTGQDFNPLTDFIGTIRDSFWSTPYIQSEGEQTDDWATKTRLYWLVDVDDIFQPDFEDDVESLTLTMTVGKDWEFDESGRFLLHPQGPSDEDVLAGKAKPRLISPSSTYGRHLDLCTGKRDSYVGGNIQDILVREGMEPIVPNLTDVGAFLRHHGLVDSRDAQIWKGFQLTWRGGRIVYRPRRGEPAIDLNDPAEVAELRWTALPVALNGVPENAQGQVQQPQAPRPGPGVAAVAELVQNLAQSANVATQGVTVHHSGAPVAQDPTPAPEAPMPSTVSTVVSGGQVDGRATVLAAAQAAGATDQQLPVLSSLAAAAANHGEFVRNAGLVLGAESPVLAAVAVDPGAW